MHIQNLAVFSGSRSGTGSSFQQATIELAEMMFTKGMTLVYGGGSMGLMGILSKRILELGGQTIGIVPEIFRDPDDEKKVTRLIMTKDMAQRKSEMIRIADAFLVLPGGIGTIDEYSETIVYNQLGIGSKPAVILNVDGFYDHFEAFIQHMFTKRFLLECDRKYFHFASSVKEAFELFENL